MKLAWSNFSLDLSKKTHIMGILNVTPDSFSDGGTFFGKDTAVEQGLKMAEDGVDIIDIGGESTRPGSDPLPIDEELRRTIPVIESLSKKLSVPISIDTYKAEVARRALDAGASLVNDITGLRFDPAMPEVIAAYGVPLVIMHIRGTPKDMQEHPVYEALIMEIVEYLRQGIRLAVQSGVSEDLIIIDPGIGFGKTYDHNLQILRDLSEFVSLQKPILVGPSRKAFLGKILDNAPPSERLEGTAAAVAVSILNGASIVRVHDVREMARVARVVDAIKFGSIVNS